MESERFQGSCEFIASEIPTGKDGGDIFFFVGNDDGCALRNFDLDGRSHDEIDDDSLAMFLEADGMTMRKILLHHGEKAPFHFYKVIEDLKGGPM